MSYSKLLCCALLLAAFLVSDVAAQDTKTLFGTEANVGFAWGLDLKANSIQGEVGTLWEMYAGARINRSTMVAFAGGLNIGHPTVNYGYLGLLGQYALNRDEIFHVSGQLLVGAGSTRDYEQEKTSLFDNYGNISGPGFFLVEPAVNAELNLTAKTKLILGLGYRVVTGLDEDHELISTTRVTNEDLSGLNLILGVQFGL